MVAVPRGGPTESPNLLVSPDLTRRVAGYTRRTDVYADAAAGVPHARGLPAGAGGR